MKKINIIFTILISILLTAYRSENNKQITNNSKSVEIQTNTKCNKPPYMTLTSNKKIGKKICIQLMYDEGENIWADLNNNKQFDVGEKIKSKIISEIEYMFDEGYSADKSTTLSNSRFTIYGPVKYLFCPESEITQIDVSNNPYLEGIFCDNNSIKNLNISKNPNLRILLCSENPINNIDISNNTNLEVLKLPKSLEAKVFSFKNWHSIEELLEKQNLIPENYHILDIANDTENYDDLISENKDLLVLFEKDIPYADRNSENITKLSYFKNTGNKTYKFVAEGNAIVNNVDEIRISNNKIYYRIYENMDGYLDIIFNIKNGKIYKAQND